MTNKDILDRWRANVNAAGIQLTEEDMRRIAERGLVGRVEAFEALVARLDAVNIVPDYLHLLTATEPRHD